MKTVRNHQVRCLPIGAILLVLSCAVAAQQPSNAPTPGKTWKVAEHNTGSYGKDVEYEVTRGETTWNGQPAVLFTRSTGYKVVAPRDQLRWYALLGPDDKPVATWDPPIGFDLPLRPGASSGRDYSMVWPGGAISFPYSCSVGPMETVTVRAGTFDAYRVDCRSSGAQDAYWYAPAVEQVVKTDLRRPVGAVLGEGTQQAELVEAPH